MIQKAPVLLHQEVNTTLINSINYYIQQGVPLYEIKQILDTINLDLTRLIEQQIKEAQIEYEQALTAQLANEVKKEAD